MKKLIFTAALLVLAASMLEAQIVNYGNLTLNNPPNSYEAYQLGPNTQWWDLTKGDLILTYSIDLSGVSQTSASETPYVQVGIRQQGAANFNPGPFNTYQGGAGGWMTSLVGDLATNPVLSDLDDKHNLNASGGRGEGDYDATDPNTVVAPFGTFINHAIWFDRDGVDATQATCVNNIDGVTYNTGGVYEIEVTYHAVSPTLGTMFATVNGEATGFWTGSYSCSDKGDINPAGLSFKGDMTTMQPFAGVWWTSGASGTVQLNNITLNGTTGDVLVPVELTSLQANAGDGVVTLNWTTASETENLGFHVYRSLQSDGQYQRISEEIISGAGNSAETHNYSFIDADVESGRSYFYKIADVDFDGNMTFHGPVSVAVEALPADYSLAQNFPNPFNPTTVIRFQLPLNGDVRLAIYNTAGQLVRTLAQGEMAAGNHSMTWDGMDDFGSRVASGVYLYRLQAGTFVAQRKLVFTK